MVEEGSEHYRRSFWRAAVKGVLIGIGFVAIAVIFGFALKPLAPRYSEPVVAAEAVPAAARAPAGKPVSTPDTPAKPAGPRVAILVTEFGNDLDFGAQAIEKLPSVIGIAFLPAGKASRALSHKAAVYGHEVWVGLPMQPLGWPRVNPGPNTLLLGDPPATNASRAEWALAQVEKPVGAYTMMGSAFTTNADALAPVVNMMKQHDLVLMDARSVSGTVAAKTALAAGGHALSNDMFIDNDPSPSAIAAALHRLALQAKARGQAVGIARAIPSTIAVLPSWAEQLGDMGVTLVPPSQLAQ